MRIAPASRGARKSTSKMWMAGLPAQKRSRPCSSVCLRQRFRQVGILDHRAAAVHLHEVAELVRRALSWARSWTTPRRVLREVMAEEDRVGHLDQRIVHLEIEDVPDAALRAGGPAGRCRRSAVSVPPWPLGLRNSRPGASSSSLPVARSRAGIVPWRKKNTSSARQAEVTLLREERLASPRPSRGWS